MTTPQAVHDPDVAELEAYLLVNFADRKVELVDVNPRLRQLAEIWLHLNGADFAFGRKMRAVLDAKGKLTPQQAKGVLNCARIAAIRDAPPEPAQAVAEPPRCRVCGRPLRDAASIQRGAGPSCSLRTMTVGSSAPS